MSTLTVVYCSVSRLGPDGGPWHGIVCAWRSSKAISGSVQLRSTAAPSLNNISDANAATRVGFAAPRGQDPARFGEPHDAGLRRRLSRRPRPSSGWQAIGLCYALPRRRVSLPIKPRLRWAQYQQLPRSGGKAKKQAKQAADDKAKNGVAAVPVGALARFLVARAGRFFAAELRVG